MKPARSTIRNRRAAHAAVSAKKRPTGSDLRLKSFRDGLRAPGSSTATENTRDY